MRPTNLQFRSPKEATPGPYHPRVTSYGVKLGPKPAVPRKTFGNSRRFSEYDINAQRLGSLVGPATYRQDSYSVGRNHIKGAHVYRPYYVGKDIGSNGLYFIGNHIVHDLPREDAFPSKSRSLRPETAQSRALTPDLNSARKSSHVFVRRNISVVRSTHPTVE